MNEGQFLWLAIITVGQVMQVVATVWSFKRKPPLTEELYKEFLRKAEHSAICGLSALDHHNTDTHKQIFDQMRQDRESADEKLQQVFRAVQADFKTLERGLGRVEGMIKRASGEDQ